MDKAFFVLLCAACFSCSASAGQMYRCGNSFQQAPCDGDKSGAMTVKEAMLGSHDGAADSAGAGSQRVARKEKSQRQASKTGSERLRKTAKSSGMQAANCPTALEIRNARVSANSLTLSDKERARRLKAIEKMEQCPKKR